MSDEQDIVHRLRAGFTDWDGSELCDQTPPMDCLTAGDVRDAFVEIGRLRAELAAARDAASLDVARASLMASDLTLQHSAHEIKALRAELAFAKKYSAHVEKILAAYKEVSANEAAELAEWRKLRDPATLHVNLLRGVPAQLPREMYLHLGGVNEIREELAAARADAERYRWLRNRAPFGPDVRPVVWMTKSNHDGPDAHLTWLDDEELDAAIDAARVESDSTGGKPCSTT